MNALKKWQSIAKLLPDCEETEQQRRRSYYQNLLDKSLPVQWRGRVLLIEIENLTWHLAVESSVAAYQVRLLSDEILRRLLSLQKLHKKPTLKTVVIPDLGAQIKKNVAIPEFLGKKIHYNDAQAQQIIDDFLASEFTDKKNNDI